MILFAIQLHKAVRITKRNEYCVLHRRLAYAVCMQRYVRRVAVLQRKIAYRSDLR